MQTKACMVSVAWVSSCGELALGPKVKYPECTGSEDETDLRRNMLAGHWVALSNSKIDAKLPSVALALC